MTEAGGAAAFVAVIYEGPTWLTAAVIVFAVFGGTGLGVVAGHRLRHSAAELKEPFSVLQGALLGLVALLLAFGLSLAIDRYENRRAATVTDANVIGTTYLRAQTLREPMRSQSLENLKAYTDAEIALTDTELGSDEQEQAIERGQEIQARLWKAAGQTLQADPQASAPRLYVESLNDAIDQQTVRIAGLSNRVPGAVKLVEIVGATLALALLAAYLSVLGRGVAPVFIAAGLVSALLYVTADLDRPTQGLIKVPDTSLVNLRDSMEAPPAARGPGP